LLGVLLYELLTGSTPLAKKRVATAAYDEIRRLIREEEPPKPSTRLSTSESLASIAAQRHTEPAKLPKLVRGDLDWITMKALEKDRTRRYETANGLARDIQRYLADEEVEARPPSKAYRLQQFARKYRAALTTAVALVLLLVAGITASTWLAVRALRAEAVARDAQHAEAERAEGERRANADLSARNAEVVTEQAKVQVRFDMAMKAIRLLHTGVSEDMLLKNAEVTELHRRLLKEAAGFYTDLEKQRELRATSRPGTGCSAPACRQPGRRGLRSPAPGHDSLCRGRPRRPHLGPGEPSEPTYPLPECGAVGPAGVEDVHQARAQAHSCQHRCSTLHNALLSGKALTEKQPIALLLQKRCPTNRPSFCNHFER
jgi:hypothetical protein